MYHLFKLSAYKTGELNSYTNISKEEFYSYIADFCIDWRSVLYTLEVESKGNDEELLKLINQLTLEEFSFEERSLYPSNETRTFSLYKHAEKGLVKCTNTKSEDWFFMTTCFPDFIDWLKENMQLYVQDLENALEFPL